MEPLRQASPRHRPMKQAVEVGSFARAEIQRYKYFRPGYRARGRCPTRYAGVLLVATQARQSGPAFCSCNQE